MARKAPEYSQEAREKAARLPGSLTYIDLIRKNKRDSALLMFLMALLVGAVFGAIAIPIGMYAAPGDADLPSLLPSVLIGVGAGLVVAMGTAAWSWNSGSKAILRMARAHKLDKSGDPELFNVTEEMAIAAGLPVPEIYIIGDDTMNAFATGRDPERAAVAITMGLRQTLSREELQAVIAHEVAHIRHLDIRFSMLMATMVGLIVFATDAFLRVAWHSGHVSGSVRKGGGQARLVMLVVALLLAAVAPLAATVIQMGYSRRREYLADAGAVQLTRNPEALASALNKLAGDPRPLVRGANRGTAHMYIVNPLRRSKVHKGTKSSLFSSHPPVQDRIAKLLALSR